MKALALANNNGREQEDEGEEEKEKEKSAGSNVISADNTFAERAEAYYLKRPQLLALLQDLYNSYLSLADRYTQTVTKQQNRRHFSFSHRDFNNSDGDSDVESSLSYQSPDPRGHHHRSSSTNNIVTVTIGSKPDTPAIEVDVIVAELVIRMVESDVVLHELGLTEKRWGESLRKTELQGSLLEVLESERLVLLNENSRLGLRAGALVEENESLAAETLIMRRRAGELARCVLNMKEDHRVYMLSRRIEDLQGQIRSLQGQLTKRECDRLMVMINHQPLDREGTRWKNGDEKKSDGCFREFPVDDEVTSTSCSSSSKIAMVVKKDVGGKRQKKKKKKNRKEVGRWWDRVKRFDLLLCGPHADYHD